MEVLFFQIVIFLIILVSGLFGKQARNITVVVSVVFTLVMVFMTWLIILQLITIFFAFQLTENYVIDRSKTSQNLLPKEIYVPREEENNKKYNTYSLCCLILIILFAIISILLSINIDSMKTE